MIVAQSAEAWAETWEGAISVVARNLLLVTNSGGNCFIFCSDRIQHLQNSTIQEKGKIGKTSILSLKNSWGYFM